MECPVCFEAWDLEQVRPKVFAGCAHSVCAACVEDLKERQCPTCRQAFADPVLDNYALIAILESASGDTNPKVWWCLSCKRPSSSQCVVAEHDVKRPKAALRRGLAGLATRCSQQLEGVEADCFQDMQDSNALAALELLDAARAAFKQAMTLNDGKVVSCEWRDGDAGVSALAKMCLVAAAAKGRAQASGEAAAQQSAVERVPSAPCQPATQCDVGDREPDFGKLSQEKRGSKLTEKGQALLYCMHHDVRRIDDLHCCKDSAWTLAVLILASHTLEELFLVDPSESHIGRLKFMPRLRRLQVECDPIFRLRVEEIGQPSFPDPDGPKWLRLIEHPEDITLFLLKYFAESLEVVWMVLNADSGDFWCSPEDLKTKLRQCGLQRLQRLVLWRSVSCNVACCRAQLKAARRVLKGCTVQCGKCDAVPNEYF